MSRRDAIKLFLLNILSISLGSRSIRANEKKYYRNQELKNIHSGFSGNEVRDGIFHNLYGQSGGSSLWNVLKWRLSKNAQKEVKEQENYALHVIPAHDVLDDKDDFILWLGHASWLIQIDCKRIVTDPCLTSPPFVQRRTRLPIPISAIKPDYLLISHGHYDHLDTDSLEHFGGATALIPLNMTNTIKKTDSSIKCCEAGWYQRYDLAENFQVIFLPAHHWHRRGSSDYNKVLWGSFFIKTETTSIYFGGDSGYSRHFHDIGELLGPMDIAILPIAAYAPRWFMKSSHINPEEALQAFKDLKAKRFIPMHYGTFDLSDEPLGEPEKRLKNIAGKENVSFLNIGEKHPISTW